MTSPISVRLSDARAMSIQKIKHLHFDGDGVLNLSITEKKKLTL